MSAANESDGIKVWSDDFLVNRFKQELAVIDLRSTDEQNKMLPNLDSRKYYNQCYQFLKIGAVPDHKVPPFLIHISDLSSDLIKELATLDLSARKFVLKQAVGRLFEDINAALYHNSISQVLKVDLNVSPSDKITEDEEIAKCINLLREGLALYQNDDSSEIELSVSKALRLHTGSVKVRGIISGISQLFKLISAIHIKCDECDHESQKCYYPPLTYPSSAKFACISCNGKTNVTYDYINCILLKVRDTDNLGDFEEISVLVFDADTFDIHAGEEVVIIGAIEIAQTNGNKGKLIPYLYANSIKYQSREELGITDKNIESFQKFVDYPNPIERLVSMFSPNVVGHSDKKLGILLSAVNTLERKDQKRRIRLNMLFVGPPGTAKSMLGRELTKLLPNSRYVSGQNASSGKSLTAIIDKENDNIVLRHGPIALSKNAICMINEIGRMSYEDQGHLLDVLEEGRFTKDAYGLHFSIDSPTTIIATCNPFETYWSPSKSVEDRDIPIIRPLLDRFDLIFIFDDLKSEEEIRDYAKSLTKITQRKLHNYNFLRKYILHARTIQVSFTDEAQHMLDEFWIRLKLRGIAHNRGLESIYRIAIAHAKLRLKQSVDSEIARAAMESSIVWLSSRGKVAQIVEDPRDIVINNIINEIENCQCPITFQEAVRLACTRDIRVKQYFGKKQLSVEDNKKYRDIRQKFVENRFDNISIVSTKPLTLSWHASSVPVTSAKTICTTDPTDPTDQVSLPTKDESFSFPIQTIFGSDRSDRSDKKSYSMASIDDNSRNTNDSFDHSKTCEDVLNKNSDSTDCLDSPEHFNSKYQAKKEDGSHIQISEKEKLVDLILQMIEKADGAASYLIDLVDDICKKNQNLSLYIGEKRSLNENEKLRDICLKIIHHGSIELVESEPQLILRWKKPKS